MIKILNQPTQDLELLNRAGYVGKEEGPPIQPILDALTLQYGDLVLTLGAGTDTYTVPIAELLLETGGALFACDFSQTNVDMMIQQAERHDVSGHFQGICLENKKKRALPFDNESIDTILTVNALQYFVEPLFYLKELARILTPCGSLLIADWQEDQAEWVDQPSFTLNPQDLYPLLDAAGLDAYTYLSLEGYAWAIRATKPLLIDL